MEAAMKMCKKCHKWMKDNEGYLNGQEEIVKQEDCQVHPRMDNWRVARTVKALVAWGMEAAGHKISVGHPDTCQVSRVVISLGDGWVHERNAYLQLFDYERPFVELLIAEGMIERQECVRYIDGVEPRALRVTMRGHVWLKELQLREEAEKKVKAQIDRERALS
jgi:hypothetical protein